MDMSNAMEIAVGIMLVPVILLAMVYILIGAIWLSAAPVLISGWLVTKYEALTGKNKEEHKC